MKIIAINCLRVLFLIMYFKLIEWLVWNHLPIHSSLGVLLGSLIVVLTALVLAIVTVNKVVEVLRS